MLDLSNSIKVVIPKPTKQPHFNFQFNEQGQLAFYKGKMAQDVIKNNFMSVFKGFKYANPMKKGTAIIGTKEYIPMDYFRKTKAILPYINDIKLADISLDGSQITLKGEVVSQNVKKLIASRLSRTLGNQIKINNLLTVEPFEVIQAPASVNKPLNAKDCQKELTHLLSGSMVHFNSGSAVIKNDSFELLNELAQTTKSCQNVKIEIVGHTDKTGNEANNIKLSKARASAVAKYLVESGVQTEKLSAMGIGSALPIATNDTPEGRSQNRRIEFKVHSL